MRNYAALFDALTERQRTVMGRLAVDDESALEDNETVQQLQRLGLVWRDLGGAFFMPFGIHIAWCDWFSQHLSAEDIALLEDAERAPKDG